MFIAEPSEDVLCHLGVIDEESEYPVDGEQNG